ncbi:hypothetical protein KIH74_05365 [Kineosporia sp. J2-2]|uniref:Chromosome segregation ATPase n=1 Tax=Kineosporia corallincola TaxID=2835133 RepID=A0ABS5TDQ8_9ACTN|nr:hypothetical protein [Kineosporia corallincola]MBT0768341.1 hypothetical protein [Kineosporia corallincola]
MSTESPERETSTCRLDGCEEPLPPRPRDELGRPKGGRRARYCSKAHADAASRQRRANDLAAVADPLALAKEATQGVLPVAKQLSEQLTALMARFEQAEQGALARVQAAETEAGEAHAEAARAAEGEQQAEQARREALAAARTDREEKDQALRRASQAQAEAERIRDETWKQVVEHERARGQAEAELSVVHQQLETLRREHGDLLETAQEQRNRATQLDLQLATTGVELRQAGERVAELSARLDQETRAREQARHQVAALETSLHAAEQQAARQAQHQEQAQQAARAEIAELRAQLAGAATAGAPQTPPAPGQQVPARPPARPVGARRRSRIAGTRPARNPPGS